MIDKIVEFKDCSGCGACFNVCPTNAIILNEKGVEVIAEKCVKCGACLKVCTYLNQPNGNLIKGCFASWSKDNKVLENSASSGIVTVFAQSIIKNNGVVFGVKYQDNQLKFSYTDKISELKEFQGSKYVQAYNEKIFISIKEFLIQGRQVLFVGTPCQVAGLKAFLKNDYENLLTIDLICHGVSKQEYLKEYLFKILKGKSWDKVLFRGKDGISLAVYDTSDKLIYKREKGYDSFYTAYARGLISKDYCYSCQYAKLERMGDITLGDFWGLDKSSLKGEYPKNKEISLTFVNTEKGEKLFQDLLKTNQIYCEERNVEEALRLNKQLQSPINKHEERQAFKNNLAKNGFNYALNKTKLCKHTKFAYLKFRLKKILFKGEKL